MNWLTYKFRIYPTQNQIRSLVSWSSICRFLWNLGHEQRLIGMDRPKGERIFITAVEQKKQLTQLRGLYPWIASVPRHVADDAFNRLEIAWELWHNGITKKPKYKKQRDRVSITEFDPLQFRVINNKLYFPKLSPIKLVAHRKMQGIAKTCTIKQDCSHWYVYIKCQIEPNRQTANNPCCVGLDRGVNNIVADSDGTIVVNPRFYDKALKRIRLLQRRVSRKQPGSSNRRKASFKLNRLHQKIRFQRIDFLHKLTTAYAVKYGCVVLENLKVENMKRGYCSAGIQDSGWGKIKELLSYKLEMSNKELVFVPAQYTSQTCSSCSHVDSNSRKLSDFTCTSCGFKAHSDVNAAKVILFRAGRSATPVDNCTTKTIGRSRKVKLRLVRRQCKDHQTYKDQLERNTIKMQKPTKKQYVDRCTYFERNLLAIQEKLLSSKTDDILHVGQICRDIQKLLEGAPSLEVKSKEPAVEAPLVDEETGEPLVEVEVIVGEEPVSE